MSLVAMQAPDRRPSPPNTYLRPSSDESLAISLGTNNPFRRSASPGNAQLSPVRRITPPNAGRERPMSRNPFLDPPTGANSISKAEPDAATTKLVDDIFRDQPSPEKSRQNIPAHPNGPPPRHIASNGHRPTRSGDMKDAPRLVRPRPDGDRHGPFSPEKQRMRRNSDSSLMDKDKAEEERRRKERRREREARREKEGKDGKDSKDGKPRERSSKPIRRPQGFDVIDKLDLTGIYGTGLIHHDGPFDACNPHRNKKTNHRAPMQAFHPKSLNNALGGNSPRQFDHDKFHGRGVEGFADYAASGHDYTLEPEKREKVPVFINPTDRGMQIHGEESTGLGTSTFLEGAPASRSAQIRRESQNEMPPMNPSPGGLGRTKSLAMRIRGLSQPRRPGEGVGNRMNSPDGYGADSPPPGTQSAGGPLRARPMAQETNPFFDTNHDVAYEKKGNKIEIAEASGGGRSGSGSYNTPRAGLTRAITTDSAPTSSSSTTDRKDQPSGGFINRMKSLKGGKRPRPEIKG